MKNIANNIVMMMGMCMAEDMCMFCNVHFPMRSLLQVN